MKNYSFSPSTKGFYLEGLHSVIPSDAVKITEAEYTSLMGKLQGGQVISFANGKPTTIAVDTSVTWDAIRSQRDALLTSCDWTMLADAPLTAAKKAEWTTYRQALRDIPDSGTDASKVVWPTKPA
jgi:hypothetical protein